MPDDFRADQFIGPLRNALVMHSLGASVLTGLRGNVVIPKFKSGMSAGWVSENEALSDSGMDFDDPVTLKPRHVGAITELSRQLIQQSSPDINSLVRDDLSFVMGEALDRALLSGDGVKEPLGRTDLTALVLIGQVGGVWQAHAYFWGPAQGLHDRAQKDRVPYDLWVSQGFLRTTPGATVDI
ncbi:phage major capsid protein [Achromobacter insuavis]|uniref:phage major capsid protein n=1 Tax=Achromobacter insuavis TaxID=1287735 RepID=UPI003217A286